MAARPTHPWVIFGALSLLFFLVTAGTFNSLGVVLPAMVRELNWNWSQAGLGFTLLGVSCGLSSVPAGALVRRLGVAATMLIGGALLAGGFCAMAVTKSVWVYLAATTVLGVAFTLSSTVPGTYVLTGIFRHRSTALGAYFTIGSLGGVAGPLLYNAIGPTEGWRAFWWVFAAAAAALTAFAVAVTPNRIDVAPDDVAATSASVSTRATARCRRLDGPFGVRHAAVLRDRRRLHDVPAHQHHGARFRGRAPDRAGHIGEAGGGHAQPRGPDRRRRRGGRRRGRRTGAAQDPSDRLPRRPDRRHRRPGAGAGMAVDEPCTSSASASAMASASSPRPCCC